MPNKYDNKALDSRIVGFLFVTTCETKNGFLLIAVFSKLINPQIEGHLEMIQVVFPIYQNYKEFRVSVCFCTLQTMLDDLYEQI
jgi:hypothetical protein